MTDSEQSDSERGAFHGARISKWAWAWGWHTGTLYTVSARVDLRDWWVGLFRDPEKQRLFISPFPCLLLVIGRTR